jgi:hypothetical protein
MVVHQQPTGFLIRVLKDYVEAYESGWRPEIHSVGGMEEDVDRARDALEEIRNWQTERRDRYL